MDKIKKDSTTLKDGQTLQNMVSVVRTRWRGSVDVYRPMFSALKAARPSKILATNLQLPGPQDGDNLRKYFQVRKIKHRCTHAYKKMQRLIDPKAWVEPLKFPWLRLHCLKV